MASGVSREREALSDGVIYFWLPLCTFANFFTFSSDAMPLSDLWKRKTPEELLRQNQRALNRIVR